MTLAVAETLSPNKPNLHMTLAVGETLSPNKPNLHMAQAVAEALSNTKPKALNPNKESPTVSQLVVDMVVGLVQNVRVGFHGAV